MYKFKSFYCLCNLLLVAHFVSAQQRPSHNTRREIPGQITVVQRNGTHNISLPVSRSATRPAVANRTENHNRQERRANPASRPNVFAEKTALPVTFHSINGRLSPDVYIYRRPAAPQPQARVVNGASTSSFCATGTITLSSQDDIDNFSDNYPGCTSVENLIIDGEDASPAIANLNELSHLTGVDNLSIRNTSVATLNPLNNLTSIMGELAIENNPLLTSLGLLNLTSLTWLTLTDLPALTDIDGLANQITSIEKIKIENVPLTNLNGLSGLTQINIQLEIRSTAITNLAELTNLTELGYLLLDNNQQQTSLGLTNLTRLGGVTIWNCPAFSNIGPLTAQLNETEIGSVYLYNTALPNLSGLEGLTGIVNFIAWFNSDLTSLDGLENITHADYGISLWSNPSLTNISGFSGIQHVDYGKLEINGCGALESLAGLGNITNIGGGLWIMNNPLLTTLQDLNSNLIIQATLDDEDPDQNKLRIWNNEQLALCSFVPVCAFLESHSSSDTEIHDNAAGCSSISEIQANCGNTCTGLPEQTWTGNNSSDWNDPDNWYPTGVPGSCTKVTIWESSLTNDPMATGDINIGGLMMIDGAYLNMDWHNLYIKNTFWMENASIWYAGNIVANGIVDPHVVSSSFEGNLSILNYTGTHEFWWNSVWGNTVLSDAPERTDYSSTFLNSFYGDLTFINNSDAGNMYLSNASAGDSYYDFVQGNLTVVNNSSANISVGLGDGRPIKVQGDVNINASDGRVDIHNLTLVGGTFNPYTRQLGSNRIVIDNLFLEYDAETRLDHNVEINNSLVFDEGSNKINTTYENLLILNNGATVTRDPANNRGFVNGPVKKIGNEAFTFPVGKYEFDFGGDNYGPISISAPAADTDEFTAEYFHHNPGAEGYDTSLYEPGFGGISGKEYWNLQRNNGNSDVQVTLSYDSARSGIAYQYDLMQVAGWNGSLWKSWSSGGYTGNIQSGTVISATPLTEYGPLTLSFKPVRKPVISITAMDPIRCLNSAFYVHYTADTAMIAGNQMRVEISDTLGNFSTFWNPTFGSKFTSAAADSILFYSTVLQPDKDYKIRIVGNLPPDTSINTQTIRFITAPQNTVTITGSDQACLGDGEYKYYPSFTEPGVTYSWVLSGGGTLTTNGDTAIVNWATTGLYSLQLTAMNACGNVVRGLWVQVNPPAPTDAPVITKVGRWLYASQPNPAQNATGYKWYRNNVLINDAADPSYYASLAGNYIVKYYNLCGEGPASNAVSFAANAIAQTINFPAIGNKIYGDAPFSLMATSSSGLPVSFAIINGPGQITGNTFTITTAGTATIRASQPGNDVYDTAAFIFQNIVINQASQTIDFPVIADQVFGSEALPLNATASSGLPVTYSILSGPAYLSGTQVIYSGLGNVTVEAKQNGNSNYLAATAVTRTFCVRVADLTTIAGPQYVCPGQSAYYHINKINGLTYSWRLADGTTYPSTTDSVHITWGASGTYTLIVSATGPCGAPTVNDSLVVNVVTAVTPGAVSNMLPANGATGLALPLTLSWLPGTNALSYDLYVWHADSTEPVQPYAANITNVSYNLPFGSLIHGQTYKWRIVSKNACLQAQSTVQTFTLKELPDLVVSNVQVPATAFSGQTITINWSVTNEGPGNTATNQSWTDAVFLSFDTIPNFTISPNTSPAAWNQLEFPVRPLLIATRPNVSALDNGQHYDNSINFTLPVNYNQPLYVYVITNYPAHSSLQQMSVANDTARAPEAIDVTLSPTPDLRVDTVFAPSSVFSGSTVSVTYKVQNYGVLTPPGSGWTDKFYISQSPIFNIHNAIPLKLPRANGTYYPNAADATVSNNMQLPEDDSYTKAVDVVIPNFISGQWFIYVHTNANNTLYEGALANNNINSKQLQVFLTPTPQLTISSLNVPVTAASTTQPIGINWNILNTGFNDNIEKNKGHYYIPNGQHCYTSSDGSGSIASPQLVDSIGFGSSYWKDKVYLSTDLSGINGNAILIGEKTHGILNSGLNVENYPIPYTQCSPAPNINTHNVISNGSNHPAVYNFSVPANLLPGNYYVYVQANANQDVYEYPGTPQIRRSDLPITIQRPDVTVSATVPAVSYAGLPVNISYDVLNNGPGAVFGAVRNDRIYISASSVFDGSAQLIGTQTFTEDLPTGTAVPHTFTYNMPNGVLGNRYFYVHTNFDSTFRETNYNNNISAAAATNVVNPTAVDLVVSGVPLADTVFTILNSKLKYTVTNNGPGSTYSNWVDSIFISCNPTFNPATSYFVAKREHSSVLAMGSNYTDSFNVNLPFSWVINNCFPQITYATAYFFVKTNASGTLYEGSNGNNNVTGSGARVLTNPLVDHIVTTVTGPDTAIVARPFSTSWAVKNIGLNPGASQYNTWYDAVYFSPDSVENSNAVLASYFLESTRLETGQTYTDTKPAIPPNLPTGDYYVMVKSDAYSYIGAEKVTNNNSNFIRNSDGTAKKIHVIQPLLPDLVDSILTAPSTVPVGQPVTVVHRVTNTGEGPTYPGQFSVRLWLSGDFVPGNGGDVSLAGRNISRVLQPGESLNDTIAFTLGLNTVPGNYILIAQADALNSIVEADEANNLAFSYLTIYSPAPVDLVVENIQKPDTVYLGYTIDTAKWVIANNSPNTASGISSDGVYLSSNTTLDSSAVLVGIKTKNINMPPLGRDTITLQPLITTLPEGNYNVLVRTDMLNNIPETNKDNNTGVAAGAIYVKAKELKLDITETNTLHTIGRYYKLVIPDSLNGSTILVTLKTNDSLTMRNEMYIGQGYVPSPAQFDYKFGTANYGNQQVVMTSVVDSVYYILVRCASASPSVQDITLDAVVLPFAILNVNANSGGNIGNVTVRISGSLFSNNMVATLSKPGTTIYSSAVYYTNSTAVFATFNLQGRELGLYDVSLIKQDSSVATLGGSFTITNANNGGIHTGGGNNTGQSGSGNEPGCDPGTPGGVNSLLVTEVVVPEKVFVGWPFVIQINYTNPANFDVPAQVRTLYNDKEVSMAHAQAGLASGAPSLYIELTEPGGPPGIIRAGASGTITVYGKTPPDMPGHTFINFTLK